MINYPSTCDYEATINIIRRYQEIYEKQLEKEEEDDIQSDI